MRRYWHRIDYNEVINQQPYKLKEYYDFREKTGFFDDDYMGYPESAVRYILHEKLRLRSSGLFLQSNYIRQQEKEDRKRSRKNRKYTKNKYFHIIYYIYFLYYKMDAFLYSCQLFFGYFGDKGFRKFILVIAYFPPFVIFRFLGFCLLYFLFIFPLKCIFKFIYFFFVWVLYKKAFYYIKIFSIRFCNIFVSLFGNFFSNYFDKTLSTKKKTTLKSYFNMYFSPYLHYFISIKNQRLYSRYKRRMFIYEMQDLYLYFLKYTFTRWIVEIYYVLYQIIFLFYPVVIPLIILSPFIAFGYYLFYFYINNIYFVIFIVFIFFLFVFYSIRILSCIELAKINLVKFALEPINWNALNIISKITVIYNIYRRIFRRGLTKDATFNRRLIRFFNYHEVTMIESNFVRENNVFMRQDKKRKPSFFKKFRLYPHLPPRYWAQYGKCRYFGVIAGFYFIKNLLAGISKLKVFERKNIFLFRNPLARTNKKLNFFSFLWLFYLTFFFIIFTYIIKIFNYFFISFKFFNIANYFFKKLTFWFFLFLIVFYLVPDCLKIWITLLDSSNFTEFLIGFFKVFYYHPFYFHFFICFIGSLLSYWMYYKNFSVMSSSFTFHIYVINKINFIFQLLIFILFLNFFFSLIFSGFLFYFTDDILIKHVFCLSYFESVIYNIIFLFLFN